MPYTTYSKLCPVCIIFNFSLAISGSEFLATYSAKDMKPPPTLNIMVLFSMTANTILVPTR